MLIVDKESVKLYDGIIFWFATLSDISLKIAIAIACRAVTVFIMGFSILIKILPFYRTCTIAFVAFFLIIFLILYFRQRIVCFL